MLHVLVAYYILISTCHVHGIVALVYLKKIYDVVKDRRDYENLLLMTIGISINKFENHVRFLKTLRGKLLKRTFPMETFK